MHDRGMIKWQPFSSVVDTNILINSILIEKKKIAKPVLSNDQLHILNELLVESFYNQNKIKIIYFKNNLSYKVEGIITSIDVNNKIIRIDNKIKLHISQILQINT